MLAAKGGHFETVKVLIDAGAEVNKRYNMVNAARLIL